ncbi:hypothetical protein B0J18DRAFT_360336 [Chaetomium sp. MPI-SDFR-AT-0129]|nr:hypothetical protein B0J18DRAFT_360336 [Chaetomium sp. MPI-SDFR-AT-0129]
MTTPVAAAAEAAVQTIPRRFGTKQVYLPNHVIAFIRPKPRQPPNLATFVVPLQFNKLDMRDYLWHVYNVEVTAVRSFVNQFGPRQKHGHTGRTFRPRSGKMMIAELVKPFVWPELPEEKDLEDFDIGMHQRLSKNRKKSMDQQMNPGVIPLRTQTEIPADRRALRAEAEEILRGSGVADAEPEARDLVVPGGGEEKGVSSVLGDPGPGGSWKEVEKDVKF